MLCSTGPFCLGRVGPHCPHTSLCTRVVILNVISCVHVPVRCAVSVLSLHRWQSCDGLCGEGYFCPPGSTSPNALPCGNASVICPVGAFAPTIVSSGFYSIGGVNSSLNIAQLPCAPATYCVEGVSMDCPAGRWGNNGTGFSTICPNVCSAGFLCPARSTDQAPCGAVNVFCVDGVRHAVPPGMYSTPESGPRDQRTGAALCPLGSYCVGGERTPCAAGRYGATTSLNISDCSGQCSAGYVCNGTGNISPTAQPCGSPAVYCPAGSAAAIPVTDGYYSLGGTSATRSAQVCDRLRSHSLYSHSLSPVSCPKCVHHARSRSCLLSSVNAFSLVGWCASTAHV